MEQKDKLKMMVGDLKKFLDEGFKDNPFFAIIYGSYAEGVENTNSDLDIMISCKHKDRRLMQKCIDFVIELHKKNSLKLDNEVKYENKLVLSFSFLKRSIFGEGFKIIKGRFHIPPVVKTRGYLDSEELLLRLIHSNMVHNHIFITGDKKIYKLFRSVAIKSLMAIIISNKNKLRFTKEELIKSYIWNEKSTGDFFLGYLDRECDYNYLSKVVDESLRLLKKEGLVSYSKNYYQFSKKILNPNTIKSFD
jgi:predicted nucleotidyltransferase